MRPKGLAFLAIVLATSLAAAAPALAQSNSASSNKSTNDNGIGIGVEAMASFPSFSDVNAKLDTKNGYGFGLWVGGNRGGTVGFVGEFIYKINQETDTSVTPNVTAKHYALQIPAAFHINFGQKSNKNGALGYVVVGPVFTINVKNTLSSGVSGDNFQSANVGLIYGAGFEIARVSIEGRINQDFRQVTNNGGGVWGTSKERAFELLGKFRFN